MPNGHILQLASLPVRQPKIGMALLRAHAIAAVIRLSRDPTRCPDATMSRAVAVEWIRKPGNDPASTVQREIGWDGVPDLTNCCATFQLTWNEQDLTELAAIAVVALLIEDLEGGVLERVLPVGSGGDYLVLTRRARKLDQVEISGVREDANGRATRKRLLEKADQVLTHSKVGFASVTAFSHPPGANVRSCLHFVRRRRKRKRR